jgi:hypothetical protein
MRVPNKDEEHRLAVVDLVLDIGGSALICKKCEYFLPQDVRSQRIYGKSTRQHQSFDTTWRHMSGLSSSLIPLSFLFVLMALDPIPIYEFTRDMAATNAVTEPSVST